MFWGDFDTEDVVFWFSGAEFLWGIMEQVGGSHYSASRTKFEIVVPLIRDLLVFAKKTAVYLRTGLRCVCFLIMRHHKQRQANDEQYFWKWCCGIVGSPFALSRSVSVRDQELCFDGKMLSWSYLNPSPRSLREIFIGLIADIFSLDIRYIDI